MKKTTGISNVKPASLWWKHSVVRVQRRQIYKLTMLCIATPWQLVDLVYLESESLMQCNVNNKKLLYVTVNNIYFQFNSIQMSFIGMRKHLFTLPKQVSKYNKVFKMGNIYTVGGGTALCKQSHIVWFCTVYTGYEAFWNK